MASLPAREMKIGKIVDKTLGVLEANAVPALIFLVVLTALSVPVNYFAAGSLSFTRLVGAQLLTAAFGTVCGYFLLVAMLRRTGLLTQTSEDAFLPYIGLSVLSSLGVLLGVLALVLPGLFIMARWIVAGPILVAGGNGVMASLGESWERTRGSEFQIIGAGLALGLVLIAGGIAVSVFLEAESLPRIIVAQVLSSAASVMFLALGVTLYGIMAAASEKQATPAS